MAMAHVDLSTVTRVSRHAAGGFRRVTLGDLMHHRRRMGQLGSREGFINISQWMAEEIPVRFAKQLMGFYRLPFMAMVSPSLQQVHHVHLQTFETLAAFRRIKTGNDVEEYATVLRHEFESQLDTIRLLREGLVELRGVLGPEDLRPLHGFLDDFLTIKIGSRVVAENFVNWFDRLKQGEDAVASPGVIHKGKLAPWLHNVAEATQDLARSVYDGECPEVHIDDSQDTEVLLIPSHLNFIFQEVLKNAVCATMEFHRSASAGSPIPPVQVSIRPGTYDVEIKVSDHGGGMKRRLLKRIWDYGFSGPTAQDLHGGKGVEGVGVVAAQVAVGGSPRGPNQLAGYGIGVPLCKLFARYFGGDMNISSVFGYGTDVCVRLNRLGDHAELGCCVKEGEADDLRQHRYGSPGQCW